MTIKSCVITTSRADYGLIKPLLIKIAKDRAFKLQLVVAGMHLCRKFGFTSSEIRNDGFSIDAKVDIGLGTDSPLGISKSAALAIKGFARAYQKLKPDIVMLLGDRFEMFGAAVAAHIAGIPIAHIQGGETTEGAFDEAFRHSITKMSQLHFASTEKYRDRIIQLGEDPRRVFNVGALGAAGMKKADLLPKKALEDNLGIRFGKYNLLVTFHPVTLEKNTMKKETDELLSALDGVRQANIIFTKANADTFGSIINKRISGYVSKNSRRAAAFASMGRLNYLSAMRYADAVVGNSSSGIIEAPSLGKPSVNIGDRQSGRIKTASVIDCEPSAISIKRAIDKALSRKFRSLCLKVKNPYYKRDTAKNIIRQIKKNIDNVKNLKKVFYDINGR